MSKYSEELIVEALKMYKAKTPIIEIQVKLGLPMGMRGTNLVNRWRRNAGLPARRSPNHNWNKIKEEVQT